MSHPQKKAALRRSHCRRPSIVQYFAWPEDRTADEDETALEVGVLKASETR